MEMLGLKPFFNVSILFKGPHEDQTKPRSTDSCYPIVILMLHLRATDGSIKTVHSSKDER